MFYPLKYLEAEGEKLLDNSNNSHNDNSFTKTKLNEMLKAWAADYDEQVDDQPFSGSPLISLVADAYAPMPGTLRSHLPKDSEKLQHQVQDLKLVWDKDLQQRVLPAKPTTQFLAYEQLTMRQQAGVQVFVAIVAPAGFGKSHFLTVFMLYEQLQGRQWQTLAPSGVAAANVKGLTIHALFQLNTDGFTRMEDNSEESTRLTNIAGLVIDEYTMLDVDIWGIIRKMCQRFPLLRHLRKQHASPLFGFRDVMLIGDLCQLPPASGKAPLVTTLDFQERFEFFVLKENRRQEKDVEYARLLNRIRTGGFQDDHAWPTVGVTEFDAMRDIVDEDVREYFINAYVRGWGYNGSNADLEDGVAMASLRRDKNRWNDAIVQQIEEKYPSCEKVNVPCAYDDGLGYIYFDTNNAEHRRNRQMYPHMLRLRTCFEHRCRLVCLKNLDLHIRGIVNGTALRALPTRSWAGNGVFNRKGDKIGQSKHVDTIDVIADANFTLTTTKDDQQTRAKEHRSGTQDFIDIGIATEMNREKSSLGNCVQVPVDLGYAVTIHKGFAKSMLCSKACLHMASCMFRIHAHHLRGIFPALEFLLKTCSSRSSNA